MFLSVPQQRNSGQSVKTSEGNRSISQVTYKNSTSSLLTQSKQELKNLRSIQNGFHVANLYQRFELIDKVLFVLIFLNCVGIAAYVQLQMRMIKPMHHRDHIQQVKTVGQLQRFKYLSSWILWLNFILTCLAIPASFFRHYLQSQYEIIQKKQTQFISQIYQIIFILLQPLPFWNNYQILLPLETSFDGYIEIKFNLILVIISIIKCLIIVRYLFWHNLCRYFDIRSQKFFKPAYNRICKIYSCQNTYLHIMKCLFKQNFIVFIGGFYLICMTTCAYCLRIIESHFDGRFSDIGNCMWFTLLSMTTVGYGDLFVSTPIGIFIDSFLMFSGVVIVSLLVSSLNDLFTMGYRQKRSLTLLKRLKQKGQLKQIAAVFIARWLERNWFEKKTGKRIKVSQEERLSIRKFNQLRLSLRCGRQKQLNLYRDMSNQFQSLKIHLCELMDTCEEDIHSISQKQRLTLNRDSKRSDSFRNRSSSYYNMIRLKSRDSRVSIMQPIFQSSQNKEEWKNQLKLQVNTDGNLSSEEQNQKQVQQNKQFKIDNIDI